MINLIENKLIQLQQSVDNKGKLTVKTIQQLMSDIPCILKRLPHMSITSLTQLQPGINSGVILSCKVTSLVSNKSDIPGSFGVMDMQGVFGVVSLYNASPTLYTNINKYANI